MIKVHAVEGRLVSEYNALKAGIANRYVGYERDEQGELAMNYSAVEVEDNSYYRRCIKQGDLEIAIPVISVSAAKSKSSPSSSKREKE